MTGLDPEGDFKVTDRRRRPSDADETSRMPARGASAPAVSPPPAAETPRARPGDMASPSRADERTLVGLFIMLGTTAAVALGAPDPVTGERHPDPAQAAQLIDLLSLLRERTDGRRIPEETRVLDELIYDLQLRYVEVTRRSG